MKPSLSPNEIKALLKKELRDAKQKIIQLETKLAKSESLREALNNRLNSYRDDNEWTRFDDCLSD